jgi:hypothetical protein
MYHNTSNQTDQLKTNVLNKIIMTRPMDHPLFTLLYGSTYDRKLSAIPHRPTSSKFKVFEMDPMPDEATVSGAHTAADTTITVDDATPFVSRDNIQIVTNPAGTAGEICRVESVTSTVITVQDRGMFNSTAAAISNAATVKKIGSSVGEGGVATKGSLIPRPSSYTGCVQYFMEEVGASAHRLSEEAYYGEEWPIWLRDAVERFKKSIELAFMCNNLADYTTTSDFTTTAADYGQVIFNTDGLHGRISTNRFSEPGASYDQFKKKVGAAIKVNESAPDIDWVGLCPWDTWNHISNWGEDKLITRESEKTFGFVPSYLRVPGVNRNSLLPLFYCPVMDQTMFDRGMIMLSMGQSSGVPHVQVRPMQEKSGPRKGKSWDFNLISQDGVDITGIGLTAQVLRRIEAIVGFQINVEKKHVIFDELAA